MIVFINVISTGFIWLPVTKTPRNVTKCNVNRALSTELQNCLIYEHFCLSWVNGFWLAMMIPHFCLRLIERPHRFPIKLMSESLWISTCLVASFRSCVLSWFFLWHLVWLSVMQLRHYLFIGTLNPMLNRLADNDSSLGKHQNHSFYRTHLSAGCEMKRFRSFYSLSHTNYCLLFSPPLLLSLHLISCSESVHQCFCHDAAVWSAVCSLERAHYGQTQGKASGSWWINDWCFNCRCVCVCIIASLFITYWPFSLLQERLSGRRTCAPPLSLCSSPPCSACCSPCVPPFLSSRCSTSPLFFKSSIAPSSMGETQRSLTSRE